jgi:hypothetical protein
VCENCFSLGHVTYEDVLKFLNIYTLYDTRPHLNTLLFSTVDSGLKCWPSVLDITGIRVLLVILGTSPCSLLLLKPLRPLDAFQLLTLYAKVTSLGNTLLHSNILY